MGILVRRPGAGVWAAALLLTGCTVAPGGRYPPSPAPAPAPRAPERVVVVEPPRADLSGDWVLSGPGGGAARGPDRGRDEGPPGQARGRDREQPPGQAREREREQPPGQARQPDRDQPPGPARAEQTAFAAGAAPRLRIVQDDHAFTLLREGAVPLTLTYDGRPVYFSGPRGETRGAVSGQWRGRAFEVRWETFGARVVTETYEVNGNGSRLTVRARLLEGSRPDDRSAPTRFVYGRVGGRRP